MDNQVGELRLLFHRLNNQLGIILSHAELLEAKSTDPMNRSRASQVIASVLDAMGTTRELRFKMADPASQTTPAAPSPSRAATAASTER